jgi:hypothetical protein
VKQPEKLKSKKPESPKRGILSRSLWLEILFFVALGVFAFSVVAYWLRGEEEGDLIRIAAGPTSVPEGEAPALYEAPSSRERPEPTLSPIFTPSVQYWEREILTWAEDNGVDPNAVATLMQIESCGNPEAESWVGAAGLFQVMPFHFESGEDQFDPDTNAKRGLAYFASGLEQSNGHAGLAMAGYNGGHGVIASPYENWPEETQRYYRWGSGIYREASAGWESSPTLAAWLAAGGQSLCTTAEAELGINTGR